MTTIGWTAAALVYGAICALGGAWWASRDRICEDLDWEAGE
jgi:hypothetical protein